MEVFLQLFLAALLGGLIGLEREYKKREAGLKTYSLVSLASAFFVIIAFGAFRQVEGQLGVEFDPSRIIGQIVLGVGFLGAGMIIYRGLHIEGLTTAAGLWTAAAVGAAVGAKLFLESIFVSFLAIVILVALRFFEEKVFNKGDKTPEKK